MGIGKNYGKEVIIDLHNCDVSRFNRKDITLYFEQLCDLIDMERCDLHFWDDEDTPEAEKQTEPHLKGTSAIQFIMTSNITIHTLDILKTVYINIFSCKNFKVSDAVSFSKEFFNGKVVSKTMIVRK